MTRKIFFRPERCLMCLSCVLSCQLKSLGTGDARCLPPGKPLKRISPVFSRGTPWMWKCQQCSKAPCAEACISGSIRHKVDGKGVEHRPETCVGCGSCLLACPFSIPTFDREEKRMSKCNLCPEEPIPPCVKACQSQALVFQEVSRFSREKKRRYLLQSGETHEPG
jgi:carbon-monoxide dehydrogenase iron sulfur subunit